jgi:hypothetical protein
MSHWRPHQRRRPHLLPRRPLRRHPTLQTPPHRHHHHLRHHLLCRRQHQPTPPLLHLRHRPQRRRRQLQPTPPRHRPHRRHQRHRRHHHLCPQARYLQEVCPSCLWCPSTSWTQTATPCATTTQPALRMSAPMMASHSLQRCTLLSTPPAQQAPRPSSLERQHSFRTNRQACTAGWPRCPLAQSRPPHATRRASSATSPPSARPPSSPTPALACPTTACRWWRLRPAAPWC